MTQPALVQNGGGEDCSDRRARSCACTSAALELADAAVASTTAAPSRATDAMDAMESVRIVWLMAALRTGLRCSHYCGAVRGRR